MSKNNSIFASNFVTHFNYKPVFETINDEINPNLVPHEALSIREILVRSSRGQRINVHTRLQPNGRPDDMVPDSEESDILDETIHDTPPDGIIDIVDVYAFQEELEQRKQALKEKQKKNVSKSKTEEKKQEKTPEKESPQSPEGEEA